MKRALLGLVLLAAGSGGSRSFIRADGADFPISLSGGLRDADGQLVADARKVIVGKLDISYKAWSAVGWLIPIANRERDVSAEVNEQVRRAGGDGVIDVEVRATNCLWSYFTIFGLLPDCSNVSVRGTIVKVEPPGRADRI